MPVWNNMFFGLFSCYASGYCCRWKGSVCAQQILTRTQQATAAAVPHSSRWQWPAIVTSQTSKSRPKDSKSRIICLGEPMSKIPKREQGDVISKSLGFSGRQGPSVRNMRNNTSSYPSRIAMKNRYFQLRNTLLCLCTLPKNWPMLTDFWANMQTCIAKMAVHLFCLQFHMT